MNARDTALTQIVTLARENAISAKDITQAMRQDTDHSGGILTKVLAYIGGVFILSGLCAYTGMFWGDMNSAARVIITLGTGFTCLLLGIVFSHQKSYTRAVPVMFLLAGFIQPGGMAVLVYEYFNYGSGWHMVSTIIFGLLLIQQFSLFTKYRSAVLLFFSILYAYCLYFTWTDWLGVAYDLSSVVAGTTLLLLSYGLSRYYTKQEYYAVIGLGYTTGAIMLFISAFSLLENSPIELLYLGLCVLMVYVSTAVKRTELLVISVIALLIYIGYFTSQNFVNSVGWPVSLMIGGLLMIFTSAGAIKIKRKYIAS